MKLFTFTCRAFQDDELCGLVEWRGQPFKIATFAYPFEEWTVKAWIKAPNRRAAIHALRHVREVRNLDGGR